jgi:hypothetical protein
MMAGAVGGEGGAASARGVPGVPVPMGGDASERRVEHLSARIPRVSFRHEPVAIVTQALRELLVHLACDVHAGLAGEHLHSLRRIGSGRVALSTLPPPRRGRWVQTIWLQSCAPPLMSAVPRNRSGGRMAQFFSLRVARTRQAPSHIPGGDVV